MSDNGSGKSDVPRDEKHGEDHRMEFDEAAAANRQTVTTAKKDPKPEDDESESPPPNFYNKFVSSFENALASLSGSECASNPKQKLSSLDIEGVAQFIRENKPSNVIVMTGAGISTSAGIPDFRSPGTGLYDNLSQYNLPDPAAIFEINFFKNNPEPFFTLARDLFPDNLKPTACHYFIRLLDEKGLLRRCFTQNIDSLEYVAGINPDKVVTAHGSHHTNTCMSCAEKYDLKWITEKLNDKKCKVPRCDECGGVVKPDIVFFGENLPKRFFNCAISDMPKCDLLIIMGTSLVVHPFAGLVHEVSDDVPRLLINLTEAGRNGLFERALGIPGLCYGYKDNYRDVFWQGTCDDGALQLAELLGWKDELKAIIEREHAIIDKKSKENHKETKAPHQETSKENKPSSSDKQV